MILTDYEFCFIGERHDENTGMSSRFILARGKATPHKNGLRRKITGDISLMSKPSFIIHGFLPIENL